MNLRPVIMTSENQYCTWLYFRHTNIKHTQRYDGSQTMQTLTQHMTSMDGSMLPVLADQTTANINPTYDIDGRINVARPGRPIPTQRQHRHRGCSFGFPKHLPVAGIYNNVLIFVAICGSSISLTCWEIIHSYSACVHWNSSSSSVQHKQLLWTYSLSLC